VNQAGLEALLGKVLVVVAHQDDETACAAVLQRAREAKVVFATDGAPDSEYFWGRLGSRQKYASVRRAESLESLAVIRLAEPVFLEYPSRHIPFRDQELYCCLPDALEALENIVHSFKPNALLAPAYEGGHPDHDACSFLVHTVGRRLFIPTWEMPLYYRSSTGDLVYQKFRDSLGSEVMAILTETELRRRGQMLEKYVSQPDASTFVSAPAECYRPQPNYDYSLAPHCGPLNYEVWGWRMTGADLCMAFQSCEGMTRNLTFKNQPIS